LRNQHAEITKENNRIFQSLNDPAVSRIEVDAITPAIARSCSLSTSRSVVSMMCYVYPG
jgi:hypothetical protein